MEWQREGLGRNRRGERPKNTMGALMVLILIMVGGTYSYLQRAKDPVRIFAAKILDCPPQKLNVRPNGEELIIKGCDRVLYARCDEDGCVDVDAFQ